jgi:hypothetical protein
MFNKTAILLKGDKRMNEYKICYSMFQIVNGKISNNSVHFSSCVSTIIGETFESAVEDFKREQFEKGWHIDFICEGDSAFDIEVYDLERQKPKNLYVVNYEYADTKNRVRTDTWLIAVENEVKLKELIDYNFNVFKTAGYRAISYSFTKAIKTHNDYEIKIVPKGVR